jgi:hypothetical protein
MHNDSEWGLNRYKDNKKRRAEALPIYLYVYTVLFCMKLQVKQTSKRIASN